LRSCNIKPARGLNCRHQRRTRRPAGRLAAPQIQTANTTQSRTDRGKFARLGRHTCGGPITRCKRNPPWRAMRNDINPRNAAQPRQPGKNLLRDRKFMIQYQGCEIRLQMLENRRNVIDARINNQQPGHARSRAAKNQTIINRRGRRLARTLRKKSMRAFNISKPIHSVPH
jgi:hypothetical protein